MFIYTFLCFIIYTFTLSGYHLPWYIVLPLISPLFCCCPFYFLSFFITKKYICPKKNSVIYLSCYRVSISPLQAVNCIPWAVKICLFLSNLYHRCLCHTYVNACLDCVFIYWEYINHFMYRSVFWFVYNYNNWPKGFSQWFFLLQKSIVKRCNTAVMKRKRKKSHFVFLFLFFSFTSVFSPVGLSRQGDDNFRRNSIAFILSHHIRAELSFGRYLIILETMCH